jgi:capsule biosynthesis phosphatase
MKYRFCVDLDGTICYTKKEGECYSDVEPIPGSIETLQTLRKNGHYIIIYTARNMITYNNNIGKIIANQSSVVIEWLKKHNIPYDELHFGKPVADYYIDDKAVKFENWNDIKKLGE